MSKFSNLTFSGSAFSGPLRDASGRPVYTLEPINGTLRGLKGVTVSRADGTSVGALTFPSIFSGPGQTNINGQDIPDLLQTSRNGLLLRPEYGFLDGQGNEFCWKNLTVRLKYGLGSGTFPNDGTSSLQCYSRDDKVVATCTRPVTHSFGKNECVPKPN